MSKKIVRVFILAFFALAISMAPSAFASSDASHAPAQAATHGEAVDQHASPQSTSDSHAVVEGHGDAAAGHGEVHGGSLSPTKLKDLFWRTVNFIALLILLIKFLAKPIANGLAGRQQRVKEELEDLQAKRDEAERSYKEFESRLAGMEKEMEVVVEKAVAQAQVEKVRILDEAEKAADDIKRQAEAAVQAELVEARKTLQNEVADQAAAMAEELIVKNLTADDQVKITEQYLNRVGAVQ